MFASTSQGGPHRGLTLRLQLLDLLNEILCRRLFGGQFLCQLLACCFQLVEGCKRVRPGRSEGRSGYPFDANDDRGDLRGEQVFADLRI